jgi:hypothetical protein
METAAGQPVAVSFLKMEFPPVIHRAARIGSLRRVIFCLDCEEVR